ncbi:MAG: substrate-binding domain-containing protein [Myxococcales bacterium]|nr:substrate-binding domain-containing protein [Myxococcales bacterium]MDH5305588.1 substrate-binding domain-containing protein [Myxococcales bacterium]MDH5567489.1 substrate-binding domain-containing protein [Myxococcales bacterium]
MRLRCIDMVATAAVSLLLASSGCGEGSGKLLLATTTSVRDSGLLDTLVPVFQERTGIEVQVIAVGSGAALRMGSEGNADVLLTHAPEGEQALVTSGAALSRKPFMENYFVIAGPAADPAGVGAAASAAQAYQRIAAAGAAYVSRGDDSGTHRREQALLREAGLDAEGGWPGFARTGAGMGITLQVAGERGAYVLSDLGTFLAFQQHTGLAALSKPTPDLRNVYSVLRIDSARFASGINAEGAQRFEDFLLAPDTQQRIAEYGVERFGRPLFRPLLLRE